MSTETSKQNICSLPSTIITNIYAHLTSVRQTQNCVCSL